eukprot:IDg6001t1
MNGLFKRIRFQLLSVVVPLDTEVEQYSVPTPTLGVGYSSLAAAQLSAEELEL